MEEDTILYDFIFSEEHRYLIDTLDDRIFSTKRNMFLEIKKLNKENKLNSLSMTEKFPKETSDLIDSVATTSNFDYALEQLQEKYAKISLQYAIIKANQMLANGIKATDVLTELNKVSLNYEQKDFYTMEEASYQLCDYIEQSNKNNIKFGIPELDEITKGILCNTFCIVGARAGGGKTMFGVQVALSAAEQQKKVLYFSLEMIAGELLLKMYSRKLKVDSSKILANTDETWKMGIGIMNKLPINVNDKAQYVEDIVSIIKKEKMKNNVDLVIIDYVGLLKTREKSFSRENELAKISRSLKMTTNDLKVPILILAQLNREAEDKEPTLAMLRESGSLEQDANKVLFLWQDPQDLGIEVRDKTGNIIQGFEKMKLKIAKNREGQRKQLDLCVNKAIGQISFLKVVNKIGGQNEKNRN